MDFLVYVVPFQFIWLVLHLHKPFLQFFMRDRDVPKHISLDSVGLFVRNNFFGRVALYMFLNLLLSTLVPFWGLFSSYFGYFALCLLLDALMLLSILKKEEMTVQLLEGCRIFVIGVMLIYLIV